jgi:hypothetical protein
VVRGRLKPEGDRPVLDGHADLLEDRVHVLTHVCAGRRRLVRVQQVSSDWSVIASHGHWYRLSSLA